MKTLESLPLAVLFACYAPLMAAEKITIAATLRQAHPGNKVDTSLGSSGKFHTQI